MRISNPSNDGADDIETERPYMVDVEIKGSCKLLFHGWSNESVAEKAAAKKGSAAKKTDDVNSYVYRNANGVICLPGRYLTASITDAKNGSAKYLVDPRSNGRKSALDLYKAGVIPLTELAPITRACGKVAAEWDEIDQQRAVVNHSGITRSRPAFYEGWRATVRLQVQIPQYIDEIQLHKVLTSAGQLTGIGDFRPQYGRFQVTRFERVELDL